MKHNYFNRLFICVVMMIPMAVVANVPNGYYNTLNGKSGQALKNAIWELTRNRTVHSYSSLWYYFRETDRMESDASRVWDMYSDKSYYFTSNGTGATSGMNKEHSLPKSWWGGYNENQGYYAYTDLNHLYPSDADANMAKSNFPLGEVSTERFNNGVTKVGTPVAGQGGGSTIVFEPDARYKGDFARTYFYMAACYQDYEWKYKYMYSEDNWLTLTPWSIDLLLRWAREDPVSDKEVARNDAVYKCQNNRNPFIDNPELIEYIWGEKQGQVFNVDDTTPIDDGPAEIISPTEDMMFDLGQVAIGRSISITIPVKGHNLTNNINVMVYRYDSDLFSTNVTSIDRTKANSAEGYPLVVTYTPNEIGTHRTRLVLYDGGLDGSYGVSLIAECLDIPSLSTPVALEPEEVTDSTYIAVWEPVTEEVDYYIVNRTIYDMDHNVVDSETFTTDDASQTSMQFTDRKRGQSHVYTVQSYRLGYMSEPSQRITLSPTGVSDIHADLPLAYISGEGYVLIKCGDPLHNVYIYNVSGQLIRFIPLLENDAEIRLPVGVYVLTSTSRSTPVKIVVR